MDVVQFNSRRGPLRHRPPTNISSAPYEPLRRSTDAKVHGLKDIRHLVGKATAERAHAHFKEEAPRKLQDRGHAKRRMSIATSESSDRLNMAGSNEVDGDATGASKRMGQTRAPSSRNEKKQPGPVVKNPVKTLIGLLAPVATSSRPRRQAPSSPSQTRQQSRERRHSSPPPKTSSAPGDQTAHHNDKGQPHLHRPQSRSAMSLNRSDSDAESTTNSTSIPRRAAHHGARHLPADDPSAANLIESKPATSSEKPRKIKRGLVAPLDKMAALARALAVAKSASASSINAFLPLPAALESALVEASDDNVAVNAAVAFATTQSGPRTSQRRSNLDQPSETARISSATKRPEREPVEAAESSVKPDKTNGGDVQRRRMPPRKRPSSAIKPEEEQPLAQDAGGWTPRAKVPKTKRRDPASAAKSTPFKTTTPSKKNARTHVDGVDASVPAKSIPPILHRSLMGSLPTHPLVMPSKDAREAMRLRHVEEMDKSRAWLQSCVRDVSNKSWAELAPTGVCFSL